tara:strand:- start:2070 stop:2717 length:648 start_codon:yes stop_codon:yes gene_type:complete
VVDINEVCDAVYCINLDRRPDRWEQFKNLWDGLGIDIQRFPAVDARNLTYEEGTYRDNDEFHNKSSIGCALSHVQVMERSVYSGHKEILVLEDDAQPCKNFKEKFSEFYSQLPEDYNFCYLGGTNMAPPEKITENVGRSMDTKSTVAYLVKVPYAEQIASFVKGHFKQLAVDELFGKLQRDNVLHIFNPRLIHQFESYSDIIEEDVYYSWMRDLE